jgi:Flp pilus assembly protein TadB
VNAVLPVVAGVVIVAVGVGLLGGPLVVAAVPLAIGAGILLVLQVAQRRRQVTDMRKFRDEASPQKTSFTDRDRQTQTEDRVG